MNTQSQTTSTTDPVADQVHARDPHAYLRPNMRVKGQQGKPLGTVVTVDHDDEGALSAITVNHGFLIRRQTRVPVDQIKHVNQDSVVVSLNKAGLNRIPRLQRG